MGRNRKYDNQKTLRKKIAILIILISLFVGQLVVQTYQRSKERREYLEELEKIEENVELLNEQEDVNGTGREN